MLISLLLIILIGFLFLIKGADFLVDGASSMAKKLKVSDLVIGLTIVAFGTSAPELVVNIFASFRGSTEIAIGNILGSNIFNIFVVLGAAAIIFPLKVSSGTVWKEIPLSLLAAILVGVMANDSLIDRSVFSGLTRIDGLVFLAFFIIFLYYTFGIARKDVSEAKMGTAHCYTWLKSVVLVAGGLGALILGGKLIVKGAVDLALALGVSQSLIGLTIVAVGTSLPELATSVVAACKKNADIAVGNVVGSNIFNIFLILGISSMIAPLPFSLRSNPDILMTIFASLLLFVWMFVGKRHILEKWQGISFILIYIGYLIYLIARG